MAHQDIIETITAAMKNVPGMRALYLSGSYGNGLADAYSDIDFVLVADNGASDDVARIWRDAVSQTGEIVLWRDRTNVPVLINAITADWTRTDVIMLKPDQMGAHVQSSLKVLFDHDAIFDGLAKEALPTKPNTAKFKYQIEEFIRILGLLPLAEGREEYINGALGAFLLRNMLVELMIEETNAPNRGGILHLNRLITEDQKAQLMSLPPAVPTREAMIETQLAYAKMFLPMARGRAAKLGVEWPERFEEVTWAQLEKTLGIQRPY